MTDKGPQFRAAYRSWCNRNEVKPRFGAVGKHGSIAVIERFIADGLLERFETYEKDLSQMVDLIDANQSVKVQQEASFREVAASADHLYQRCLGLRERMLTS